MTREEAIKLFRRDIECLSHDKCSDCILEKACDPMRTTPLDLEYIEAFGMAIEALSEQKVGKWVCTSLISKYLSDGNTHGECSVCHKVRIVDNYCPNCGAKMEVD